MADTTKETQYNLCVDIRDRYGVTRLGLMSNYSWHVDPKRLAFLFSRYKFVSKLIAGSQHVLEIGCADAFATRIVQQVVGRVTAIDFDPIFIRDVNQRMCDTWPLTVLEHDITEAPVPGRFDAAYSLDVFEHICPEKEHGFLSNIVASLSSEGIMVLGTPTLESQVYASPGSKQGHVNCKSADALKHTLKQHFHNVFIFSMNDEVVHTGFYPMAHYLLALCCGPRTNV